MANNDSTLRNQSGPTFVAAVVISPLIFQIGFNFSAFDVIAVEHMLAAWTASLAAFAATFVIGSKNAPGLSGRWWFRLTLLVPTIWLGTEWFYYFYQTEILDLAEVVLRWIMMLVAVPAILYTLLSVAYPAVGYVANRRFRLGLWAIWVGAGLLGLFVGANHDHVLTCRDFERSGTFIPTNCWGIEQAEDE